MKAETIFLKSWNKIERAYILDPGPYTEQEHRLIKSLRARGYDKSLRISWTLNKHFLSRTIRDDMTGEFPYISFRADSKGLFFHAHFGEEYTPVRTMWILTQEIIDLLDRLASTIIIFEDQSLTQEELINQIALSGDLYTDKMRELDLKLEFNRHRLTKQNISPTKNHQN